MDVKKFVRQDKLEAALRERKLFPEGLAETLKFNVTTMYRKIGGYNDFKWSEVKEICRALGVGNPFDIFV